MVKATGKFKKGTKTPPPNTDSAEDDDENDDEESSEEPATLTKKPGKATKKPAGKAKGKTTDDDEGDDDGGSEDAGKKPAKKPLVKAKPAVKKKESKGDDEDYTWILEEAFEACGHGLHAGFLNYLHAEGFTVDDMQQWNDSRLVSVVAEFFDGKPPKSKLMGRCEAAFREFVAFQTDPTATDLLALVNAMARGKNDLDKLLKDNVHTRPPSFEGLGYLFGRQSYAQALKHINTLDHSLFHIGGTPGVGKTCFRYWCLFKWVQDQSAIMNTAFNTILFSVRREKLYAITRIGHRFTVKRLAKNEGELRDVLGGKWDVVDRKNPRTSLAILELSRAMEAFGEGQSYMACATAMITVGSPGQLASSPMSKDMADPYYLPVWSKEEVDTLHKVAPYLFPPPDELEHRIVEFGGVLRYLLRGDVGSTALDQAFEKLQPDVVSGLIRNVHVPADQAVHRIAALGAGAGSKGGGKFAGFISEPVGRRAFDVLSEDQEAKRQTLAFSLQAHGLGHSINGHHFENEFSLQFGAGTLTVVTGTGKEKTKLKNNHNGVQLYRRGMAVRSDQFYRAEAGFHGIDFFMVTNKALYMMQTTVGTRHDPLDFTHSDVANLLTKMQSQKPKLAFSKILLWYVVPLDHKDTFKAPAPLNMPHTMQTSTTTAWTDPGVFQWIKNSKKAIKRPAEADQNPESAKKKATTK